MLNFAMIAKEVLIKEPSSPIRTFGQILRYWRFSLRVGESVQRSRRNVGKLGSWSLTSLFSTNMAISETMKRGKEEYTINTLWHMKLGLDRRRGWALGTAAPNF